MGSDAMIYTLSQTHKQHDDLISLLLFFQKKERRLEVQTHFDILEKEEIIWNNYDVKLYLIATVVKGMNSKWCRIESSGGLL
jgi:hypothetical protein